MVCWVEDQLYNYRVEYVQQNEKNNEPQRCRMMKVGTVFAWSIEVWAFMS